MKRIIFFVIVVLLVSSCVNQNNKDSEIETTHLLQKMQDSTIHASFKEFKLGENKKESLARLDSLKKENKAAEYDFSLDDIDKLSISADVFPQEDKVSFKSYITIKIENRYEPLEINCIYNSIKISSIL